MSHHFHVVGASGRFVRRGFTKYYNLSMKLETVSHSVHIGEPSADRWGLYSVALGALASFSLL